MITDLSRWTGRQRLWLVAGYALIILIGSSIPGNSIPSYRFLSHDKLLHFTEYFGFGLLLMFYFENRTAAVLLTLGTGLIFAGMDEWHQPFFHRTCDILDWFADGGGLLAASLLFTWIRHRFRPGHEHE